MNKLTEKYLSEQEKPSIRSRIRNYFIRNEEKALKKYKLDMDIARKAYNKCNEIEDKEKRIRCKEKYKKNMKVVEDVYKEWKENLEKRKAEMEKRNSIN